MPSYDRALWALRIWLDSWPGIGHVAVGMARQGFDLQLTRYDDKGCELGDRADVLMLELEVALRALREAAVREPPRSST